MLDIAGRKEIDLDAIEGDNAATTRVAVIYGVSAGGCVLVGEGEAVVLREARIGFNQRRGPTGLQFCHFEVVGEEAVFEGLARGRLLGGCEGWRGHERGRESDTR